MPPNAEDKPNKRRNNRNAEKNVARLHTERALPPHTAERADQSAPFAALKQNDQNHKEGQNRHDDPKENLQKRNHVGSIFVVKFFWFENRPVERRSAHGVNDSHKGIDLQ